MAELEGAAKEAHEEKVEHEPESEPAVESHPTEDHDAPATRGDFNKLGDKIDSLATVITSLAPPIQPEKTEPSEPDLPDHGQPMDKTPVRPPWHKRKFL